MSLERRNGKNQLGHHDCCLRFPCRSGPGRLRSCLNAHSITTLQARRHPVTKSNCVTITFFGVGNKSAVLIKHHRCICPGPFVLDVYIKKIIGPTLAQKLTSSTKPPGFIYKRKKKIKTWLVMMCRRYITISFLPVSFLFHFCRLQVGLFDFFLAKFTFICCNIDWRSKIIFL